MTHGKIRVLVVDDSAMVRQTLSAIIDSDPKLQVMGVAANPFDAVRRIADEVPDVITLDVEMPRMDGVTFLRKLMHQHPIPVVICSSLAEAGSGTVMQAMEAGAVEIIKKPALGVKQFFEEERLRIIQAIKAAARARLSRLAVMHQAQRPIPVKHSADAVAPPPRPKAMARTTEKVVAIGASTGGVEALQAVLRALPHDAPGIVVAQHMPEGFTANFARRLDGLCAIAVKEAEAGDTVLRGRALIAPGNRHLLVKRSGARYYVELSDGELVNRHRPSVDVLFRSVATHAGGNALGVILTGMGDDGARGLLEMRQAGARTLAQDEATSVVFGMPKEAIERGGVDQVLPLQAIAGAILRIAN